MDDQEIAEQFLIGNQKIIQEIYSESFENVENYILSKGGSSADAEDIFHSALMQIYVKLKEEKIKINSFHNYVFIICRNLWRREKSKSRVTNTDEFPLLSEEQDQTRFSIESEQWELYSEKLNQLSDNCKTLLRMMFDKKTYAQIVDYFSYASQTVARQRVFKCKARLVQLISSDARYIRLKS